MAESKSRWVRDLLIVPLVVGLVVAFFTYVLPKLLDKGREISYSVEGPTESLNGPSLGVSISVNGVPTGQLFSYRVRIWNSGGTSLRNVPIRIVFDRPAAGFRVFVVTHSTSPRYEFGAIREVGSDSTSRRFVYELLNPGNEDVVTVVANDDPQIEVYSNVAGVRFTRSEPAQPRSMMEWASFAMTIVAVVAAMLAKVLDSLFGTLRRRERRVHDRP
jgi:hypothetical protein